MARSCRPFPRQSPSHTSDRAQLLWTNDLISERRKFVRDIGGQAVGNYASTLLRIARGVVVAGVLGPASMGIVAIGNLVMNYGQYADLGVGQAVGREMPMAFGRADPEEADAIAWYGMLARLVAGLAVSLVCFVWVLGPWSSSETLELKLVVAISGIATIVAGEMTILQTIGRSEGRFGVAVRIGVVFAVFNFVAGVIGAYVAGAVGATVSGLLAAAISTAYGWVRLRPSGDRGVRWDKLTALVRIGLPLALLTFMAFNMENIDQVMILGLLDRTSLGLYAIVLQAGGLITLAGLSVSNVIGPRLLKRFATHGTTDSIRTLTWKPTLALSALMPTVVSLAWLAGPWFIVLALPRYSPTIAPFKIYMAAMYFLVLNLGVSTTLLALNRHRRNVPIMLGCILLNVVVDIFLVRQLHMRLEGIAVGSLLTYAVYWMLHTGLVRWYFEGTMSAVVRLNLSLMWPGLVLVMMLGISVVLGTLGRPTVLVDGSFVVVAALVGAIQGRGLRGDITAILGPDNE